ncbi:MAG: hypothetical protein ACREHD_25400, partial [Pirellulales bacterium]
GCGSAAIAIGLAALVLWRRKLPSAQQAVIRKWLTSLTHAVELLHSGRANDYVAWLVVGLALFALAATCLGAPAIWP